MSLSVGGGFRIYNFIEGSMQSLDFKLTIDAAARMIEDDLKSKSRVFTWFNFNPNYEEQSEDVNGELAAPWTHTFKITVFDNGNEVISKIWDAYGLQMPILTNIDLANKVVRLTSREGRVYTFPKKTFFEENEGKMSFDLELIKAMINDKDDTLLNITKMICDACAPDKDDLGDRKFIDHRDYPRFLENYTLSDEFKSDSNTKKYWYSLKEANREVEAKWDTFLKKKTANYFNNLF